MLLNVECRIVFVYIQLDDGSLCVDSLCVFLQGLAFFGGVVFGLFLYGFFLFFSKKEWQNLLFSRSSFIFICIVELKGLRTRTVEIELYSIAAVTSIII